MKSLEKRQDDHEVPIGEEVMQGESWSANRAKNSRNKVRAGE